MTGVIIRVLFAACGIGIHFIVKDAFSRMRAVGTN
jgi:hypothetical protein